MSLQTWIAEFYPVSARECPENDLAAVEHSLRKWNGFRKKNLLKHEIELIGGYLQDKKNVLYLGKTCALCENVREDGRANCLRCPLYKVRGDVACDETRDDETTDPWRNRHEYPEAMIHWLEKTKEFVEENLSKDSEEKES